MLIPGKAAHSSSPATSDALLEELENSQPMLLERMTRAVPAMIPKAYRWVGEMEEIAGFVGGKEANIYQGMAGIYERVERARTPDNPPKCRCQKSPVFGFSVRDQISKFCPKRQRPNFFLENRSKK